MYKKTLSYILIFSLFAPDIGRCMDNDEPKQRRRSLPGQLQKASPETRKTRSRSLENSNRELTPLIPQFHRSVAFPQKSLLIEQKSAKKQQNKGALKPPLNLTELVQNSFIEPVGAKVQEDTPENLKIELKIILPQPKQEESPQEENREGDHSLSPPTDFTHSSPSSSPSKSSPLSSVETEESEASLTLSSSSDSPRGDIIVQKKEDENPVHTLMNNKHEEETAKQGKENDTSAQPLSLNPVLILPEEPLKQLSTDVNTTSQKAEEQIASSIKQPINQIEAKEAIDLSKILVPENSSPTEMSPLNLLTQEEPSRQDEPFVNKIESSKETEKDVLSLSAVENNDALISIESSQQRQQQGSSSDLNPSKEPAGLHFDFIATWKKDHKERKKIPLQKDFGKVGNIQDGINLNENTSLLSIEKRPFQNNIRKKNALLKKGGWDESGSEGNLEFRRSAGLHINDGSSDESESDIFDGWGKKSDYRERKDKELMLLSKGYVDKDSGTKSADELIETFNNPGSTGNKRKDLLINGDDFIDREEEKKLEAEKRPLPKLVPDCLKGSSVPKKEEDGARDSVICLEELGPLNQMSLSKPPSKFSQLLNPEQNQGKQSCFKKRPWLTVAALVISAGEAVAMGIVYNGELVYLRDAHGSAIIWLYFKSIASTVLPLLYIAPSVFLKDYSRNHTSLNRTAAYLEGERVDKTRIALTLVASFFTSLLEPTYLVIFQEYLMNRIHIHGWDNQFFFLAAVLSLFRLANGMISDFDAHWELQDDFKEWLKTSSFSLAKCLHPYFIHHPLLSEKDDLVALYQNRLGSFSDSLSRRSLEEINEIYTSIRDAKTTIQKELPELETDLLDTAEDFFVRRYLIASGDEEEIKAQQKTVSWSNEDIGIGSVLVAGTPFRLLAMELVWETALGLVLPPLASKILAWLFGSITFLVQTALEGKAMKTYFHDYLWDEGADGHWSHLKFRAFLKGLCSTQGVIFAGPLTVLCLRLCDLWFPSTWWMLLSPFFIFPEYTLLTNSFNNTYNKQAGSFALDCYNTNILEKRWLKDLEKDDKIDYIRRRIHKEKNRLKTLPTFDLEMLQKTLNPAEREGIINM